MTEGMQYYGPFVHSLPHIPQAEEREESQAILRHSRSEMRTRGEEPGTVISITSGSCRHCFKVMVPLKGAFLTPAIVGRDSPQVLGTNHRGNTINLRGLWK